jgi:rhomboid protease GluP
MSEQLPPPREPDEIDDAARRDDDEPDELRGPDPWPFASVALVFLNLAVGLAMAWSGVPVWMAGADDVIGFGAVDPVRVWSGDIWRLVTGCFVHVGAWHMGFNLWVLWQVGRVYERLVGASRVLLVYVVSGVFGFALSISLQPTLTAGASGAVFGITGALLAVAIVARHRQLGRFLATTLLPFVIGTFALGVLLPMVNNVAHLGGLVMGVVLGYGLVAGDPTIGTMGDASAADGERVSSARNRASIAALVLGLGTFGLALSYSLEPRFSPQFHVVMGLRDLHAAQVHAPNDGGARPGDTSHSALVESLQKQAEAHATAARDLAPHDGNTLLLLARLAEFKSLACRQGFECIDEFGRRASELKGETTSSAALGAQAFARLRDGSRTATFDAVLRQLALLEPESDMPYIDGYTVRLLCRAALDDEGRAEKAPSLKNSCAWLYARASEEPLRDPALAVELAREASAEAPDDAAITHTLAVALGDAGAAREGLALLEKLVVRGDRTLPAAMLATERQRLTRLAAQQAGASTVKTTAP